MRSAIFFGLPRVQAPAKPSPSCRIPKSPASPSIGSSRSVVREVAPGELLATIRCRGLFANERSRPASIVRSCRSPRKRNSGLIVARQIIETSIGILFWSGITFNRIGTRHPEGASLAVHLHRWRASKDGPRALSSFEGSPSGASATARLAPQDDAIGCG